MNDTDPDTDIDPEIENERYQIILSEPQIFVVFTITFKGYSKQTPFGIVPESFWNTYKDHIRSFADGFSLEDIVTQETYPIHLNRELNDPSLNLMVDELIKSQYQNDDSADLESHIQEVFDKYLESRGTEGPKEILFPIVNTTMNGVKIFLTQLNSFI